MKRRMLLTAVFLVVLLGITTAILVAASHRPVEVGLVDGRLRPCPDTPNCVSSQAQGSPGIDALALDPATALERIAALVEAEPRAKLVTREERYLHAEWSTSLVGYRDDVEFLVDPDAGVVHVRSASRVGHSDMGANRRRVEAIRARLDAGSSD